MNESKDELLGQIEESERWHFRRLTINTAGQWVTMFAVAIAGAITTFSGTSAADGTFARKPEVVLIVGIVSALGAAVNQSWNFSRRIAKHRAAALAHRIVRQGFQVGTLSKKQTVALEAKVYNHPEAALEAVSKGRG